jgi:hypothetical protein
MPGYACFPAYFGRNCIAPYTKTNAATITRNCGEMYMFGPLVPLGALGANRQ